MEQVTELNLAESFPHSYRIPPAVLERLQNGSKINNPEFDVIYPPRYKAISHIQWSPIAVARTIAETLQDRPGLRLLDVGSGVGKLCTLLSILTDWELTGVEQRKSLVKVAERVAKENSLKAQYVHSDMQHLDWSPYDAIYFYNPFHEHRLGSDYARIDDEIEYDVKILHEYVAEVRKKFYLLEPGKIVICYQGFGGEMPPCMELFESNVIFEGRYLSFYERSANKE